MNIGGGQIRGVFFNFFVLKKCLFFIFQTLPSVSKITPGYYSWYHVILGIKQLKYYFKFMEKTDIDLFYIKKTLKFYIKR